MVGRAGRRSGGDADELVAPGADPDQLDRHPDLLGQEGDVAAGGLGELAALGDAGVIDVLCIPVGDPRAQLDGLAAVAELLEPAAMASVR